ncbi:MAG: IS1595 family transposase [Rhodocyclaceae bacterium]|nr:IS1595 family transposase [Rhodocyclaceae bacterium]
MRRKMAEKYTFRNFQAEYPTDDACLLAIFKRKYGETKHCPSCGVESSMTRIEGRRAYACKEGCHVYPCAGTVFEKSRTKLTLWFHAMYLMTATRNGVSAKELQRQLGVTYKCAFRMGHQLRELMTATAEAQAAEQLTGHVEVDETYVGGYQKRDKKNHKSNKTIVVGFVQRGGNYRAEVIPANTKARLVPRVIKHVAQGATVNTDSLRSYRTLTKHGYNHVSVNHEVKQWAVGVHNTNSIEGFWSHLKRGLSSTHCAVSPKHLQAYVNEFAFRFNNRHEPAQMFGRLLGQISRV